MKGKIIGDGHSPLSPTNDREMGWITERDRYFRDVGRIKPTRALRAVKAFLIAKFNENRKVGKQLVVEGGTPDFCYMTGVSVMDSTSELLKATTDELAESKRQLQVLVNDVRALSDVLGPSLLKQIHEIRQARMTLATESATMLAALREVRKFFLDSDYQEETTRLARFITLVRELKALAADGTLDAVSDAMLKLSVRP